MFSFPTHTSVLSLHGALGCPRFRVGAVPALPGCAPTGMGTVGTALGEWILQQPEGEAGSHPTEMCGRDWGEKLLPCLVPSSVALASPRALPPQPGTAVLWGSASQLQRRKHSICTGSTTTSTPQFPKPPPNSHPALSGWDENSPGPNSSALKPHW